MKPTNPTPAAASSSFTPAHTPPSSPRLTSPPQTFTSDELKRLLAEVIQELRALPTLITATEPEAANDVELETPKARASVLGFKEVNEMFVSGRLSV